MPRKLLATLAAVTLLLGVVTGLVADSHRWGLVAAGAFPLIAFLTLAKAGRLETREVPREEVATRMRHPLWLGAVALLIGAMAAYAAELRTVWFGLTVLTFAVLLVLGTRFKRPPRNSHQGFATPDIPPRHAKAQVGARNKDRSEVLAVALAVVFLALVALFYFEGPG